MAKIVLIGAGSNIFAKNLIGDCLCTPALRDSEFALVDIDEAKLALSKGLIDALNESVNGGRARVTAHTDRREALTGADYVIVAIAVGGYETCIKNDFEIPMKYGLRQTYADTLGMGGLFRGLRTAPVMLEIARDMEELCPDAWMLNYTNPMCILTGAVLQTGIKAVGLCHSVQKCVPELLEGLGMDTGDVVSKIAGINHQAWLLDVGKDGADLYPEIKRRAQNRMKPHDDMVRYDIMEKFGYYVTESSLHTSEYTPYYIKQGYPELLERFGVRTEKFRDWGRSHAEYWQNTGKPEHSRTTEFASYIMEAMQTNAPCKIGANVLNAGLITNLPGDAVVEVPCLVDAGSIAPCFVGNLPPQCAALNRTNINPQLLAIEAAKTLKKEYIYHSALLDPHTSAELPADMIICVCDEMMELNRPFLPEYR